MYIDDTIAAIGSVNLDYRSLVHNYECGVWMYNTSSIMEIKDDFNELIKDSIKIDINKIKSVVGDGVVSVDTSADTLKVDTLYDGVKEVPNGR